jgi:hypothetical protein
VGGSQAVRRSRRLVAVTVMLAALAVAATGVALALGSPAARWAFDETSGSVATDSIGSLDGTIHGATSVADGAVGRAFRFDGGDAVTIPDATSLRADDMTIDLWVRSDAGAPPTDGQVLLDKGSVLCGGAGYAMVVDGDYLAITYRELKENVGIKTVTVGTTIVSTIWDGAWHHVSLITSRRSDGWGGFSIRIDGWFVGGTSLGTAIGIDPGEAGAEPLVIGDDDDGCGPGFIGDVDQVRVFDSIVTADILDVDEPTITTNLAIDAIGPTTINEASYVDVTLLPIPPREGTLRVFVTADDGVERVVGALELPHYTFDPDGHYRIPFTTDYGGASTVTVRFVPTYSHPALPSQASATTTITKKASWTSIGLQHTYIAGEGIRLGVGVNEGAGRTQVTGVVELYEHTQSGLVLIDSRTLTGRVGSLADGYDLTLPGRPAGDYQFEARYLGGPAYLPSSSEVTTVTIEPALEAGPVTINGGAATTDEPIVTVSVPAVGATAVWISTDLSDVRRLSVHPYSPEITTWLTAPWYGDDADGVRTVWVIWADVLGRWSDMQTDTIVLDRGRSSVADTVGPVVTAPRRGLVAETSIVSGRIDVRLPWSGSDDASGIARYELAQSTDGGAWATVSTTLTSPTSTRSLAPLHSYRFRVRGIDNAGNVGAWATGQAFRVSRYSESNGAIHYSRGWSIVSSQAYWGGAAKKSSTAGARASITFTGRSIAWVARTGPNRGRAAIYVNGTKVATVDLYSATAQAQRVVWARSWTSSVSRTVSIRVAGTAGRPRIDLDALVTTN